MRLLATRTICASSLANFSELSRRPSNDRTADRDKVLAQINALRQPVAVIAKRVKIAGISGDLNNGPCHGISLLALGRTRGGTTGPCPARSPTGQLLDSSPAIAARAAALVRRGASVSPPPAFREWSPVPVPSGRSPAAANLSPRSGAGPASKEHPIQREGWEALGKRRTLGGLLRRSPKSRALRQAGFRFVHHVEALPLVPASAAVPTAAAEQQDNDDNDQKCCGIHIALLQMK
jgi:hypothetical protein